jgi:hypothetical protein
MKTTILVCLLFFKILCVVIANDLADILQNLAVQTACLGRYTKEQTGVYAISSYDDPKDWYNPQMIENRFAKISGNMTRNNVFYGVCFDYAQFAWENIKRNQNFYNKAGMRNQEWYIAITNANDPNTIILYTSASRERATTISNGVYLQETFRYRVLAHDKTTSHAWLWVQHKNGTWYWIDPTWTDNTGYVWWGIVKEGKEVQYSPDPDYCITRNYSKLPRANEIPTEKGIRGPDPVYVNHTPVSDSKMNTSYFLMGYNHIKDLPLGFTFGWDDYYFSVNFGLVEAIEDWGSQYSAMEWTVGITYKLFDFLLLPIGLGANHSGPDEEREYKFVMEIGLQPILFNLIYLSATYRLVGFNKSGFTLGAGIVVY